MTILEFWSTWAVSYKLLCTIEYCSIMQRTGRCRQRIQCVASHGLGVSENSQFAILIRVYS